MGKEVISVDISNTTYNAQPYFTDNNSPPGQTGTSDFKTENVKLTRPVPSMNASDSQEYKGNFSLRIFDLFTV